MTDIALLTNEGLRSLHNAIMKALKIDDEAIGGDKPFGVREISHWKTWAAMLEEEMSKRGLTYPAVSW